MGAVHRSIGSGALAWLAVLLAAAVGGCAINPVTGKQELSLLGPAWEISTGQQNYAPLQQASGGAYTVDPELTEYVRRVGQRVAVHAERAFPYEFVVVNSDVPNAWALPGGKIGINRGLLVQLDSEAELAALLGHEIVHAAAGHSARNMERGLLLAGGAILVEKATEDEDYAREAAMAAQLAANLMSQRYSREAERESDYHGMRYMVAAGYDPRAAVTLQEKLLAMRADPSWLEGLFASHPPSSERVVNNRSALARFGTSGEVGRERFQQAIAYAKSKQPAYDLAAEARELAHAGQTAQALAKLDRAIRIEPEDGMLHGLRGDVLRGARRHREAIRQYDRAASMASHFSIYLGRGLSYRQLGRRAEAIRDLEASAELYPTQTAAEALGELQR